jgi:hypothetical protein
LPERCHVKVEVYTLLGTAIAQLIDTERPRGYHEVKWIAGDRPSGVYLIRLRSESKESHKQFVACKRIVLLR